MKNSPLDEDLVFLFTLAEKMLQQEAAKACPQGGVANGVLSVLVSTLAEKYLPPQAQERVKQIMQLHHRCHYPPVSA
jgi:hypothetical protein